MYKNSSQGKRHDSMESHTMILDGKSRMKRKLLLNKVRVPRTKWGQVNRNVRVWSRERFTAGPSKENGWRVLKKPELPDGFGGKVFIGKIWGEGWRVCGFLWLAGGEVTKQLSRNLALSLKLPFCAWVTALFCRGTQKCCYIYSLRSS